MSLPRNVATILQEHTTLEVECIDRMYLHLYVPLLQGEGGIAHFGREHRGQRFASSAQMGPTSRAFVGSIERFAEQDDIPRVRFLRRERKEEVAHKYLRAFPGPEGVLFIGKAQEKTRVVRTEVTGQRSAMVYGGNLGSWPVVR